jgi:peptidoglycan/xylan/chitin deacetylase (PgdA/CDA1 family)
MIKYALLTNDVETTSIWHNDLRDETGKKVLEDGMPLLLDIYNKYNIKSTFFVTAYIAKLYPNIVHMIVNNGHEIASHGKSHIQKNGFDIMPFQKQKEHLDYSKKVLEDISGQEVISFRAPALRVSSLTARALIETGFKIDSSVASQRFDFFLSFGSKNKIRFWFSPRLPYRTKVNNIFSKGNSELLEIPLSASILPFMGSTLRFMPEITKLQQKLLNWESNITGKPMVFDIHPNEFIDESNEPRIIKRRSNNIIDYLLKDIIRSHIKTKNLGYKAASIYEKFILFYVKKEYNCTTLKTYKENMNL